MTGVTGVTTWRPGTASPSSRPTKPLVDPDALVFDPDYASQSGRSVRTLGWSPSAGRLLTVITVAEDGVVYGVNGWPANDVDTRRYEGDEHE